MESPARSGAGPNGLAWARKWTRRWRIICLLWAAEAALDAVGHAGHQVEEGGAPQELDAQVDDGGVIHEEGDDGAGEK